MRHLETLLNDVYLGLLHTQLPGFMQASRFAHWSFPTLHQPKELGFLTSIARYVFRTDPRSEINLALYKSRLVRGKGEGLTAHFDRYQE